MLHVCVKNEVITNGKYRLIHKPEYASMINVKVMLKHREPFFLHFVTSKPHWTFLQVCPNCLPNIKEICLTDDKGTECAKISLKTFSYNMIKYQLYKVIKDCSYRAV